MTVTAQDGVTQHVAFCEHFYQPASKCPLTRRILRPTPKGTREKTYNELIQRQCYGTMTRAHIMNGNGNGNGRIRHFMNNLAWSGAFDMGPTLLEYMREYAPDDLRQIQTADKISALRFSGHGSAIVQGAHDHVILPLASKQDRQTQVHWAIQAFRHTFGRDPEGAFAPETCFDDETMQLFVDNRVKFLVAAPQQVEKHRPIGTAHWYDGVDCRRVYRTRLNSGDHINMVVYDGGICHGIAYENLLESAPWFCGRMEASFDNRAENQLLAMAVDGETYGHWRHGGEMCRSWATKHFMDHPRIRVVNLAQYLAENPPTWELMMKRRGWSCPHSNWARWSGETEDEILQQLKPEHERKREHEVERCHCREHPGDQRQVTWRKPFRATMDGLQKQFYAILEGRGSKLFADPWAARNNFIQVVLENTPAAAERFLDENALSSLSKQERREALDIMWMARYGMLMYTSCGWFFSCVSREEPQLCMRFATRAIQLARPYATGDLEAQFLESLARCHTNDSERHTARVLWEDLIRDDAHKAELWDLVSKIEELPETHHLNRLAELAKWWHSRNEQLDYEFKFDMWKVTIRVMEAGWLHLAGQSHASDLYKAFVRLLQVLGVDEEALSDCGYI